MVPTEAGSPGPAYPAFGLAFPPVNTPEQREFTARSLRELGLRRIRLSENWRLRQPRRGEFNWGPLDERLRWISRQGWSLLLTLEAEVPDWAQEPDAAPGVPETAAFRAYVRALLARHGNRIARIQFGNEWDNPRICAWPPEDVARCQTIVYEEARAADSGTIVVLGGLTRSLPMYQAICREKRDPILPPAAHLVADLTQEGLLQRLRRRCPEGAVIEERVQNVLAATRFDRLDLHLYDDPENWPDDVARIRRLTDRPILVSEFGCPHPKWERYTPDYHAERLQLCLDTLRRLPVEEAYHFSLVDLPNAYHRHSGLFDTAGHPKPAWKVLQRFLQKPAAAAPDRQREAGPSEADAK